MSIVRRIIIPPEVTTEHRGVIRRYVQSISGLPAHDWPLVIEAFNLLREYAHWKDKMRQYQISRGELP